MPKIFIPVYAPREQIDFIVDALNNDIGLDTVHNRAFNGAVYEGRVENNRGTAGIVLKFGWDDEEIKVPPIHELIKARGETE